MTVNVAKGQKEKYEKLLSLLRIIVQYDTQLRERYAVGDRFRFVRDRLHALLADFEAAAPVLAVVAEPLQYGRPEAAESEIYIYLYNAQGAVLRSWAALLTARALYDHSINRPVYTEFAQIETLLRGKSNPAQHAILKMGVVGSDLIEVEGRADATGNPLFRVKEGALKSENFISLIHNGHEYILNAQGELVRKEVSQTPPSSG